jgi:hypothetical protein
MAMVVPSGLVLEQVLGVHAAVRPDHVVGDLSSFQQVDKNCRDTPRMDAASTVVSLAWCWTIMTDFLSFRSPINSTRNE